MDSSDDEQTELLRLIWNEMKALGQNLGGRIEALRADTNARFVELESKLGGRIEGLRADTNTCFAETNGRLDEVVGRLDVVEHAVRDLAAQQVIAGRYLRRFADRHRDDIRDLRVRVARLESKR
jgi:hypothetical protein